MNDSPPTEIIGRLWVVYVVLMKHVRLGFLYRIEIEHGHVMAVLY
jgi:hypothetical protein